MEYVISDKTLNKIVNLMEDKPFKLVINLLNEIKAVPFYPDDFQEMVEAIPDNNEIDKL